MVKNIIGELWTFIEREKEKTKIAEKVFNWMNYDNLSGIIVYESNCFYFELTNSYVKMPNYIYDYLKKWTKKLGYTYLYDN